jgi:hypothetical protein
MLELISFIVDEKRITIAGRIGRTRERESWHRQQEKEKKPSAVDEKCVGTKTRLMSRSRAFKLHLPSPRYF